MQIFLTGGIGYIGSLLAPGRTGTEEDVSDNPTEPSALPLRPRGA